jgi:hypothetical protein
MPGAGASSMIFWWRRCIEQSRSPSHTALLVRVGQDLDLDVARVLQELLHVDGRVAEGGTGLGTVVCTACSRAASVCTTRMPRPPPPPAALMITG